MTAGTVIVGAGHCGVSAAQGAQMAGLEGPITLIGDEAELPYERLPLCAIFPDDWCHTHDTSLMRATHVTKIDCTRQTVKLSGGDTCSYTKPLLATGASARQIPPDTMPGVYLRYVNTYADAQKLAQEVSAGAGVLIVGGGFIGLELAASLSARNAFLHVIEAQDRILARAVAPAIAQKTLHLHSEHGVTIHIGSAVNAVEDRVAFLSSRQSVWAEQVTARRNMCGGRLVRHVQGVCLHCGGWAIGAIDQIAPAAIVQSSRDLGGLPLGDDGPVRHHGAPVGADQGDVTHDDLGDDIALDFRSQFHKAIENGADTGVADGGRLVRWKIHLTVRVEHRRDAVEVALLQKRADAMGDVARSVCNAVGHVV
nr:FAD-dependent oxidoreductase [uncultured Tateyamaria sp.]